MSHWSRRSIVFALVLAAAPLVADTARRLTAHVSVVGAAPDRKLFEGIKGAQGAGERVPAHIVPAPVVPPPMQIAHTPPTMKAPAGKVVPAEAPKATHAASSASAAGTATLLRNVHTFRDKNYKVSFDYPANWTFSKKDHEISTFRLDARTADRKATLRAVTAIPENPYPASTFTGAYVYLSVTPHTNEAKCAEQAAGAGAGEQAVSRLGGMSFVHGHDEQRRICTVERDEIYTTYRKGACFRFDLAINNFCGGEVSGVKDVTEQELKAVRERMEAIVSTVRFEGR